MSSWEFYRGVLSKMNWGTVADWVVAAATFTLAVVAIFQDRIRAWLSAPELEVSIRSEPPDCVSVPFTRQDTGEVVANTIHVRFWVKNVGKSLARQVEVYAQRLRRERADGSWEDVRSFPPMNLLWADLHPPTMYFPGIAPCMGKHCDLGYIIEPARRRFMPHDENPTLQLTAQQVSFTFLLVARPNHKGHIVGPGRYQIHIVVAAENARPRTKRLELFLPGPWYPEEDRMLRDGIGVGVVNT